MLGKLNKSFFISSYQFIPICNSNRAAYNSLFQTYENVLNCNMNLKIFMVSLKAPKHTNRRTLKCCHHSKGIGKVLKTRCYT